MLLVLVGLSGSVAACSGADVGDDGQQQGDRDPGDGVSTDDDGRPGDDDPIVPYGLDTRPAQAECKAFTAPPATGVRFVDRYPGIVLTTPTGMFQRPNDNSRWYVTERDGFVVWFDNDPTATERHVALDISQDIWSEIDCSLGSLAFPPNFSSSHVAYVGYCWQNPANGSQTQMRYSRFTTHDGGDTFDRASEQIILRYDMPLDAVHDAPGIHSADVARFGPDGYLYIANGDGGPQYRVGGLQAQDTNDIRGKLLRVDVSDLTKAVPNTPWVAGQQLLAVDYPADNPFASGGGHPAVYAYGLRNPWQWHFDLPTGEIWLGDVGNAHREEINRGIVKGGNYGWGVFEGTRCTDDNGFTQDDCDALTGAIMPLLDYAHGTDEQEGRAVTGGLVYRGDGVPEMTGAYVFGDSSEGRVWVIRDVDALPASGPMPAKELIASDMPVSSFAVDQNGELFATILYPNATYNVGRILALEAVPANPGASGGPPGLLSQTGCFTPADPTQPASDLIPFAPSAELWSDGATKRRWMVLPDAASVTIAADGDFVFPNGSVLIKEFSLDGQRVETRFLVHQAADGRWAGYSYQWNTAQTDATLVPASGAAVTYGAQTWFYPSRSQCTRCHTTVAGNTLGPELAQLDHALRYAASDRRANQLDTLDHIGVIDLATFTGEPPPALPALDDASASVEERARAYLHANCSNCHRAGGTTFTPPDFRYGIAFADMHVCDQVPTISDAGILDDPRLFAPGHPERSVIVARMHSVDASIRMPPVGRTIEHEPAVALITRWIGETVACP